MAEKLSPEVALRIGLAARALPDTDPARLMKVLLDAVGYPISAARLERLKLGRLKTAADGEFAAIDVDQLTTALELLKGIGVETESLETPLPVIEPFAEGDMPGSIRVACASNREARIDGHFGSCARFLIYQVSDNERRLIDIRAVRQPPEEADKNAWRAELIKDCQLLYTVSIGGPAAAKVVRAGLHPIKLPKGGLAPEMMARLSDVIATNPPPWLAKVMGHEAQERVRFHSDAEEVV